MKRKLLITLFLSAAAMAVFAQQGGPARQAIINQQQKKQTIDSVAGVLTERYIFPEVAKKTIAHLRTRLAKKAYDGITDGNSFAGALTADLQAISHDKHLRVYYSADEIPVEKEHELMSIPPEFREVLGRILIHTNYGIRKVDVLRGNIGYIDFEQLVTPEMAGDTYAAAMNYLAHTEAMIIDLRRCGGSQSPDAIPFLLSYFFETPVHLIDMQFRKGNVLKQSWTYANVPGKRYLNKPVYVLVSNGTFSGAEEMAYDLKNLKRATIIGQTTGGGANPGGELRVSSHYGMFVPVGKVQSPITKTNWEGVGVQPDTVINTKLALYKAQQMAMQNSINTTTEKEWKDALTEWLKELKASQPQFKPVVFELKGFDKAKEVYVAGSFNDWASGSQKLERKGDKWVTIAETEPGKVTYKFIVDGQWIADPGNDRKEGPNGDSVK